MDATTERDLTALVKQLSISLANLERDMAGLRSELATVRTIACGNISYSATTVPFNPGQAPVCTHRGHGAPLGDYIAAPPVRLPPVMHETITPTL